jgi:hypothetical protein
LRLCFAPRFFLPCHGRTSSALKAVRADPGADQFYLKALDGVICRGPYSLFCMDIPFVAIKIIQAE